MAIRISKNRVALESIPLNLAKSISIASASTVNLSSATGNSIHITGSTGPITSFGSVPAGSVFTLVFDATPTISYDSTSMILNTGGASYNASARDRAIAVSEGNGNWIVTIIKSDGTSVIGSGSVSTTGTVAVSTARTLSASDDGKTLSVVSSSDVIITVPASLPAGFGCAIFQSSTGVASIAASGTTIVPSVSGQMRTGGQGKITALIQTAINTYSFSGSTAA